MIGKRLITSMAYRNKEKDTKDCKVRVYVFSSNFEIYFTDFKS